MNEPILSLQCNRQKLAILSRKRCRPGQPESTGPRSGAAAHISGLAVCSSVVETNHRSVAAHAKLFPAAASWPAPRIGQVLTADRKREPHPFRGGRLYLCEPKSDCPTVHRRNSDAHSVTRHRPRKEPACFSISERGRSRRRQG